MQSVQEAQKNLDGLLKSTGGRITKYLGLKEEETTFEDAKRLLSQTDQELEHTVWRGSGE